MHIALWVSLSSTFLLFLIEAVLSGGFPDGAPWGVFAFLSVSSFVSIAALLVGFKLFARKKISGYFTMLVGIIAASAWITLFLDQLPCFLGGKGC